MKKLLLSVALAFGFFSTSFSQCSVEVNDSLLASYDYVLNATNQTGSGPFQYSWTVSDGNGVPVNYTVSAGGDSITIDAMTLQNNYGCIIYQLCMTDMMGCTTCSGDTAMVNVPFNCYSQFTSYISNPNEVSVTLNSSMPPYMVMGQFCTWTDGNGQSQGMPYMGPGTLIQYTPGPANPSNKFFLCIITSTPNGGCISCDSVQYTNSGLGLNDLSTTTLKISPNPATAQATVESSADIEAVKVYNALGQEMKLEYSTNKGIAKLNIAALPKGIYIVRVNTVSGTFEERLVKE